MARGPSKRRRLLKLSVPKSLSTTLDEAMLDDTALEDTVLGDTVLDIRRIEEKFAREGKSKRQER